MMKAGCLPWQRRTRENHGVSKCSGLKLLSSFRWAADFTKKPQDEGEADSDAIINDEKKKTVAAPLRKVLAGLEGLIRTTTRKSKSTELDASESRSDRGSEPHDQALDWTDWTALSTPKEPVYLDSHSHFDSQVVSQVVMPRTRNVSFSHIVNELPIETRKQRYGDLDAKHEAFYSHAELATFRRTWHWHNQSSKWPKKEGINCSDQWRDKTQDVGVLASGQDAGSLEDYTKWTWQG